MTQLQSDAILDRLLRLHPKIIDLTLDRTRRLLGQLGDPHRRLPPVIHVAGTNGKGSTQAMIRAGLEAEGMVVHAYTSPHLARFHERIRVAGTIIDEAALIDVLDRCEVVNGGRNITFFEVTTCAAFLAFARTPADYTLLEVGLGGRYDTTNVIEAPRLSIITPVSIDHQQYLGETLAEIASAKAGIIHRGVPCIVGPQEPAAMAVIEREAARMGSRLICHGADWHVSREGDGMIYQDEQGLLDLPLPNLRGPHQIFNAGAAIAALRHLGHGARAAEAAVTRAYWPARMQRLQTGPLVDLAGGAELWLDGGHNAAAGQALADTIADMAKRPTALVVGMLNTKDVTGFLGPLTRVADRMIAVSIPGETNTLPAEVTLQAGRQVGFDATQATSVEAAVAALAQARPGSRIVICGSLYLAGRVLRENG